MDVSFLLVLAGVFLGQYVGSTDQTDKRASAYPWVNPDEYCKQVYSNGSYLCRDNYQTGYDYLCSSLYCYDADYQHQCVYSIPPQDSTLCGNGKWCESLSCKISAQVPPSSDSCPLGDSVKPDVFGGMSCREIVTTRPSLCRHADIGSTWCCKSCRSVPPPVTYSGQPKSAEKDCQDILGPKSYFCQDDVHYGGNYTDVCSSMYCFNPSSTHCEPYPANEGVPCGDGKWCVAGKCVQSDRAAVDPTAECLYGNQYHDFCVNNVVYPNIATYCQKYETACCSACAPYKNASNVGCEYGDVTPDECKQFMTDGSIKTHCAADDSNCCGTCATIREDSDTHCPYGDVDADECEMWMNDTTGPGNCYTKSKAERCCETCPLYYNASNVDCEYGDHWKDYCAENVMPPNVATVCNRYGEMCCGTCAMYEKTGHPGCKYGDIDPNNCAALMADERGSAHCYDAVTRSQCCGTCEQIKSTTTPDCLYGDAEPGYCEGIFNTSRGLGHCYDTVTRAKCCDTCHQARNDSNTGCEYGDVQPGYCNKNIVSNDTAFVCFTHERDCCDTCAQYIVSDHPDCKFGDKDPVDCAFRISNEAEAVAKCPTKGVDCCATCSKWGHPGPAGAINKSAALLG